MKTKKLIIIFLFLYCSFIFCKTVEEFTLEADNAIAAENWESALKTLQEGIKTYPLDDNLLFKLGVLYYDKELYAPAYSIFKKGLGINSGNSYMLYYAASTAGFLNKPEEALSYIKKYLSYVPEDRTASASYGWFCFKSHRENEGVDFLLIDLEKYGEDSSIYNALATLYGELYDYKNAEACYLKAIKIAKAQNRKYAAAIYSYNKSVLERQFYYFEKALKSAHESLQLQERNSGYMMLGELEEFRNNFSKAISAYMSAAATDNTPLASLSIAGVYLNTGHTKKAEQYILSELQNKNESWIANYGLSVTEFKSSLYELQKKLYRQKFHYEKTRVTVNTADFLKKTKDSISYQLKYKYYDSMQRIYKLKAVKEYKKQSVSKNDSVSYKLKTNSYYYLIFKGLGGKALKYLKNLEYAETEIIPQSAGSYITERGISLKDINIIDKGVALLNPEWEQFLLKDVYAEKIKLSVPSSAQYYSYLKDLYNVNPSGFLDFDIKLPVDIKISIKGKIPSDISEYKIKKLITSSRFIYDTKSIFKLHIIHDKDLLTLKLTGIKDNVLYNKTVTAGRLTKEKFIEFINENVKHIFSVKL